MQASPVLEAPLQTPLERWGNVWLKREGRQVSGSVKYRMVYARVCADLASGVLRDGQTLVEASAGSTGVALALAGERLGLAVEIHAYAGASPAKLEAIRARGARVVLHPAEAPFEGIMQKIRARVAEGGYWHLDQYRRGLGQEVYRALAEEILAELARIGAPRPAWFVCPVGTGGLIQGVGSLLRERTGCQVAAVEPDPGVSIEGIRNTELVQWGDWDPYDRAFPDIRVLLKPSSLEGGRPEVGASAAAALGWAREHLRASALVVAAD